MEIPIFYESSSTIVARNKMHFEITKNCGSSRLGTIAWTLERHQQRQVPKLSTPRVICYTRTGYLPHQTLAFTHQCSSPTTKSCAYMVALEHFLEVKYSKTQSSALVTKTFQEFLCHRQQDVFFCDPRDISSTSFPASPSRSTIKTKLSTVLPNEQFGHLTVEEYVEQVGKWMPDVVFALADYGTTAIKQDLEDTNVNKRKPATRQVERNLKFLEKTVQEFQNKGLHDSVELFAVLVGEDDLQERERSAKISVSVFDKNLSGYVIPFTQPQTTLSMLKVTIDQLPSNKPRMAIGVQSLADIVLAVSAGVDLIDDAWAYKLTLNGQALVCSFKGTEMIKDFIGHGITSEPVCRENSDCNSASTSNMPFYILDMKQKQENGWARDMNPLSNACTCFACRQQYSRGYIHHLLIRNEMLALILLQVHNQAQINTFMQDIAESIDQGQFEVDSEIFLQKLKINNRLTNENSDSL